jgi:N-acetylneuraminic acid mutarotase
MLKSILRIAGRAQVHSCSIVALLFSLVSLSAFADAAWQTVTNETVCTARHEAALTALDGKIYLLGGRGIKPVEEYDPQSNTWKKLAPTPEQFHHFQALALDGRIAVVGAMTGNYPKEPAVTNVWFFDPRKNEWSKGPAMTASRARGGAGVVHDAGKIYLVCGNTNGHWNGFVPWVDVLDLKSGEWTALPDAPHARDHFQAALLNGKIVAAGGRMTYAETKQTFNLTIPEVDVFDIATRQWTTLAEKIPTPRAGCFATTRDGKVIVLGGECGKQPIAHNEVEALSLATGRWETLPALNEGRHGTGAAFIGDMLYLAAGCGKRGGSPELNSMEKLVWPVAKK